MGVLLVYPLLIACWLVPPFLIFRSPYVFGWRKTRWVMGCLLSPVALAIAVAIPIVAMIYLGAYQRDMKTIMFGWEGIVVAGANVASLALPWTIYFIFKAKFSKTS